MREEERAVELLVDRATAGLEPGLERELEGLLARHPELDADSFELAAAAIELAYTEPEPLPAALRERVARQAADRLERGAAPQREGPGRVVGSPGREEKPREVSRWLGWMAAAAALIVAILGWLPERPVPELRTAGPQVVEPSPAVEPAVARSELIAQADDLLRLVWTATEDPAAAGASGDVVWSTARQGGYMRFRGLEANDPNVFQYQLWIFDAEQDERYPIDGGVFDVLASDEVVVPIDPKLRVVEPTLFAVTVEKPGGVVVSSRERLPLMAQAR